jgi:hypothetical protein
MLLLKLPCSLQHETEGPSKGSFKDSDLATWLMGAFVIVTLLLASAAHLEELEILKMFSSNRCFISRDTREG